MQEQVFNSSRFRRFLFGTHRAFISPVSVQFGVSIGYQRRRRVLKVDQLSIRCTWKVFLNFVYFSRFLSNFSRHRNLVRAFPALSLLFFNSLFRNFYVFQFLLLMERLFDLFSFLDFQWLTNASKFYINLISSCSWLRIFIWTFTYIFAFFLACIFIYHPTYYQFVFFISLRCVDPAWLV